MVKERIVLGGRVFRVYDFLRVFKVLNFMLEADTGICRMSNGMVEVTVVVWVISWAIWAQWLHVD